MGNNRTWTSILLYFKNYGDLFVHKIAMVNFAIVFQATLRLHKYQSYKRTDFLFLVIKMNITTTYQKQINILRLSA